MLLECSGVAVSLLSSSTFVCSGLCSPGHKTDCQWRHFSDIVSHLEEDIIPEQSQPHYSTLDVIGREGIVIQNSYILKEKNNRF